ncbi:MAG: MFS transporter [Bdellovibrionaceae bacterium]|nr:MFS transporter [Pseudobdellovibrionaceae bacterium]
MLSGKTLELLSVILVLLFVIALYFRNNPLQHSQKFMMRRFLNWFPLGMTYAFLYMARYNLNIAKNEFGDIMSKADFGIIFGVGTTVYACSFLLNGPLVDKIGGKKGIIIASLGAAITNVFMGIATYAMLEGNMKFNVVAVFSTLYAFNMYFQSYGAVSIIKVKAFWFHVRERGGFGAIFGTLLSFGAYFAYGWGDIVVNLTRANMAEPNAVERFIRSVFALDSLNRDGTWYIFFVPAFIMIVWALIDMFMLKDTPAQANFEDFDTHDASSEEMHIDFSMKDLLKKVFTNPIILTFALIEFCSGVLRNAMLQWYFIFAHEVPQIGGEFFNDHWGYLLAITGVVGGFVAGYSSDYLFHSRRSPPALILNVFMFMLILVMSFVLFSNPFIVGLCVVGVWMFVIGVHSLMSGTAAADFGGRKATATASGILDGFVYLGSGLQSFCLGFLVTEDWSYWPYFMLPFAALAVVLAWRTWHALPEATKKYLVSVENVEVIVKKRRRFFVIGQQSE